MLLAGMRLPVAGNIAEFRHVTAAHELDQVLIDCYIIAAAAAAAAAASAAAAAAAAAAD